jgi:hypothetical protein
MNCTPILGHSSYLLGDDTLEIDTINLSLLMSYIYGAYSKARNLKTYIYGRDVLLGIFLLEPCISLIYA